RPTGAQHDFKMPSNNNRPSQLPQTNRPSVQARPGAGGGGIAQGNRPTTRPGTNIGGKGQSLADLQNKNPSGVFDRPNAAGGDRLPGAGSPPQRPGGGNQIASLPNLPKDRPGGLPGMGGGGTLRPSTRPGQGGSGTQLRPGTRPGQGGSGTQWPKGKFDPGGSGKFDPGKFDPGRFPNKDGGKFDPKNFDPSKFVPSGKLDPKRRPDWPGLRPDNKIGNDFSKNWNNAIGNRVNIGDKTNIAQIATQHIAPINLDMSQNANFQQLNNQRNLVNNNFQSIGNNAFNSGWWNNNPNVGNWPGYHYANYGYGSPSDWWQGPSWSGLTSWMGSAAWSPPTY